MKVLQTRKSKRNSVGTTTDNEEDQFSTSGSLEDITGRHSHSSGATYHESGSTETTDDLSKEFDGRSYSDTETDSCLPSHSLSSSVSGLTSGETDGVGDESGSLKRSLSLMRLNCEEIGVLDEVDSANITDNKTVIGEFGS